MEDTFLRQFGIKALTEPNIKVIKEGVVPSEIIELFTMPFKGKGKGTYGSVFQIIGTNKYIKMVKDTYPSKKGEYRAEATINNELSNPLNPSHQYISNFLAYLESGDHVFFVFEVPRGKTLFELMKEYHIKTRKCSPQFIYRLINDLVKGLQYIHSQNILHRDIKPSNIYVPEDPGAPIYYLDFGESVKLNPGEESFRNDRLRGTRVYSIENKVTQFNKEVKNPFARKPYIYTKGDDLFALEKTIRDFIENCPSKLKENVMKYFSERIQSNKNENSNLPTSNNINKLPEVKLFEYPLNTEEQRVAAAEKKDKIIKETIKDFLNKITNIEDLEQVIRTYAGFHLNDKQKEYYFKHTTNLKTGAASGGAAAGAGGGAAAGAGGGQEAHVQMPAESAEENLRSLNASKFGFKNENRYGGRRRITKRKYRKQKTYRSKKSKHL